MVKRFFYTAIIFVMVMVLVSCGENKADEQSAEDEGCDVAVIASMPELQEGSMDYGVWESVESLAGEYDMTAMLYLPEDEGKEYYMESIDTAVNDEAGIIIVAGSCFETAVYDAQSECEDVYFVILDGTPHDDDDTYETGTKTISIVFAEEEAGYMAGYAAVKEGYTSIAFLGGSEEPATKRYGYGFVQGAAAAADELETDVDMRYKYAGTTEQSDDVKALAADWYEDGVEVIFACGGDMNVSVMEAAEESDGKVIGSDVDQSSLSDTVITSAEKGIYAAVQEELKSYASDRLTGGTAFNYGAKNDGVALETENSALVNFSKEDYELLFEKLQNGEIDLDKDESVSSVKKLTGDHVTIAN